MMKAIGWDRYVWSNYWGLGCSMRVRLLLVMMLKFLTARVQEHIDSPHKCNDTNLDPSGTHSASLHTHLCVANCTCTLCNIKTDLRLVPSIANRVNLNNSHSPPVVSVATPVSGGQN